MPTLSPNDALSESRLTQSEGFGHPSAEQPGYEQLSSAHPSAEQLNTEARRPRKLEPLTSLRFFAAAMIFILHSSAAFNFHDSTFLSKLELSQGVCFFFVLSGFILTYVHPQLPTAKERMQFLVTRIARIWPTHAVTLFACLFLFYHGSVSAAGGWSVLLANLALVQSWLFNKAFSVSLNTPSWSISCEFFFYLCFPLLIREFAKSWRTKMALSIALVVLSLVAMFYGSATDFEGGAHIFIKTNPICRIFEFVLGMAAALAFRRYGSVVKPGVGISTLVEFIAIAGVFVALIGPGAWVTPQRELATIDAWLLIGGTAPIYGFLIFITAFGRGLISRFLSSAILVHLGEISFSLYMVHCLVLSWFASQCTAFSQDWSTWQKVAFVAVLSLGFSHINYRLVEMPCRSALTNFAKNGFRFPRPCPTTNANQVKAEHRKRLFAKFPVTELLIVPILFCFLSYCASARNGLSQAISRTTLQQMLEDNSFKNRDQLFGNQFWLRASKQTKVPGQLHVDLVWESTKDQTLLYKVNLDLLGSNGERIQRKVYLQDAQMRSIKPGAILHERVDFNLAKGELSRVKLIGISIADPKNNLLFIQNGPRDSNNQRLLLEID